VKSAVDGRSLDGIDSLRVHTATDYIGKGYIIRWTELFFVSYGSSGSDTEPQGEDPAELSRLAEHLAQAFCLALTPHLEPLAFEMLMKISLRVTIGSDQVSIIGYWSQHLQCYSNTNCSVNHTSMHSVIPIFQYVTTTACYVAFDIHDAAPSVL